MEKIRMIDSLEKGEKEALIKLIDMAISKKLLKKNLANFGVCRLSVQDDRQCVKVGL